MGSRYYYDRDGVYITLNQWAVLMADDDYRVVEQTWVWHRRWLVSTVWLGLNHNLVGAVPHIFETCVFDQHNMLDISNIQPGLLLPDSEVKARYPTLEKARKGHRRIVNELRKEVKNID